MIIFTIISKVPKVEVYLLNIENKVGKTVLKVIFVKKSYLVHLFETRGLNRDVAHALFKTLVVSDKT